MLRKTIDGIESIGYSFETQADVRRERLKLRRGNWGLGADEELGSKIWRSETKIQNHLRMSSGRFWN